ncbi:hypothetical protein OG905_26155 [Streptomyces sp. NBC_00322]|uniref:hypothetical protein n=1 Tax=Streptomyces sp. NBC_00322 TaxID=2975712 RepID=UPI002E28C7D2|nr:hypothetical protein [Streptomyces sp. NBC_00322]
MRSGDAGDRMYGTGRGAAFTVAFDGGAVTDGFVMAVEAAVWAGEGDRDFEGYGCRPGLAGCG